MFGYDILIDANLKPWLLEVNASPSMARHTHLDIRIKNAVIQDTIELLDPTPYDRVALKRIISRRLPGIRQRPLHAILKADADLERDLHDILRGQLPRAFGELPRSMGRFERLCPGTALFAHVSRSKRSIMRKGVQG
jgi:tubulin polyglutamylase TTLL5